MEDVLKNIKKKFSAENFLSRVLLESQIKKVSEDLNESKLNPNEVAGAETIAANITVVGDPPTATTEGSQKTDNQGAKDNINFHVLSKPTENPNPEENPDSDGFIIDDSVSFLD